MLTHQVKGDIAMVEVCWATAQHSQLLMKNRDMNTTGLVVVSRLWIFSNTCWLITTFKKLFNAFVFI